MGTKWEQNGNRRGNEGAERGENDTKQDNPI